MASTSAAALEPADHPASALGWRWEDAQAFLLSGPELPRVDINDAKTLENIRNKTPMIITGSSLIEPVRRRWTLDYLAKHSKDVRYSVKVSAGHFRVAEHDLNEAGFDHADMIRTATMTMPEFYSLMQAHCARDGGRTPFAGSSEEPAKVDASSATQCLLDAGLVPSRSEWRARDRLRRLQAADRSRHSAALAAAVRGRAASAEEGAAGGTRLGVTQLDALLQIGCDAVGTAAAVAGRVLRDTPVPAEPDMDAAAAAGEGEPSSAPRTTPARGGRGGGAGRRGGGAGPLGGQSGADPRSRADSDAEEGDAAGVPRSVRRALQRLHGHLGMAAPGPKAAAQEAEAQALARRRDRQAVEFLWGKAGGEGRFAAEEAAQGGGDGEAAAAKPCAEEAAAAKPCAGAAAAKPCAEEAAAAKPCAEEAAAAKPGAEEAAAAKPGAEESVRAQESDAQTATAQPDREEAAAKPSLPPWAGLPTGRSACSPVERVFLQQALCDGVGQPMIRDFRGLSWTAVSRLQGEGGWGPLTTNLLLVAQRGAVTPLRYDEQHNLLCQARGRKLVVMGAPQDWPCFYPFPVGHPCDRQAQVYPRDPDTHRFPRWAAATLQHAVLQPGEVLYIPAYWWHHVESPWEDTLSVDFWHRCSPAAPDLSQALLPSSPERLVLCRNMERLLSRALGPCSAADLLLRLQWDMPLSAPESRARADALSLLAKLLQPGEAEAFLQQIVQGRFDLPRRASTITTFHLAITQRAVLCGTVASAVGLDCSQMPLRRLIARGDIAAIARLAGWDGKS